MRIKIIGDNNCARATRHLLRLAGFAVTEFLPVMLRHDRTEALKRWLGRPDIAVEFDFAFFGIECNQQHVVDGEQRPDQEDAAEHHRGRFGENPSQTVAPTRRLRECQRDAHSCASLVWSLRINTITIGISTGSADITAATPSAGLPKSKA